MVAERYKTAFKMYPYTSNVDQNGPPRRVPVVIVGGGPIGLALAIDLGKKSIPVLVLDDHEGAGLGSKAICFAKRTLDIAHRLGAGTEMVEKGVVWNTGKVFYGDGKLFEFNLLPEDGHRNPAFINLQQPYFEKFLFDEIEAAQGQGAPIEVRGRNLVTHVDPKDDHVLVSVDTPDGAYQIEADWLIAFFYLMIYYSHRHGYRHHFHGDDVGVMLIAWFYQLELVQIGWPCLNRVTVVM